MPGIAERDLHPGQYFMPVAVGQRLHLAHRLFDIGAHVQQQHFRFARNGAYGFRAFYSGVGNGLPRADGYAMAAADAVLFRSSFQGIEAAEAGQEAGFFT